MQKQKNYPRDKVFESLITAFTFVAAISWRESLLALFEEILPTNTNILWAEFGITLFITVIVVVMIYLIRKTEDVVDARFETEDASKS